MGQHCVEFLQWALPRLGLRWAGFRKVRGQVCKRIGRRCRELGLDGLYGYRAWLEAHPAEWRRLDEMCRIPISRFFRDRALFAQLRDDFADRRGATIRCWCAGCAAGEEPYSLAILARHALPEMAFDILATDVAPHQLERARAGIYTAGSVREVPGTWRETAFEERDGRFALRPEYRPPVRFELSDIRHEMPPGPFDLILCRYLAFTYFEEALQRRILAGLTERLAPGGQLAVGRHERLPVTSS